MRHLIQVLVCGSFVQQESEIKRLSAKEAKLEADISRLQSAAQQQEPRVQELGTEVARRDQQIESLNSQISAIHNRYFSEFSERLGIPNIHEYMEASRR